MSHFDLLKLMNVNSHWKISSGTQFPTSQVSSHSFKRCLASGSKFFRAFSTASNSGTWLCLAQNSLIPCDYRWIRLSDKSEKDANAEEAKSEKESAPPPGMLCFQYHLNGAYYLNGALRIFIPSITTWK